MSSSSTTKLKFNEDTNRDIELYLKHAILKFVQTVIHSRCVENKLNTQCRQLVGAYTADWFNLAIKENPVINEEIKKLFKGKPIDLSKPLRVEIYLKTAENETMVLEHWWMMKNIKTSTTNTTVIGLYEQNCKIAFYNNLISSLKSLIQLTHSLPCYHISRKQSPSNFKLFYRFDFTEPPIEKDFKVQRFAKVSYPLLGGGGTRTTGTLVECYAAWKTNLQFEAQKTAMDFTDFKADHFLEIDGKNIRGEKRLTVANDDNDDKKRSPFSRGNLSEHAAFGKVPSPDDLLLVKLVMDDIDEVPFSNLLLMSEPKIFSCKNLNASDGPSIEGDEDREEGEGGGDGVGDGGDGHFAVSNSNVNITSAKATTIESEEDEFFKVKLKAAFAGSDEELNKFYQECQCPPKLFMLEEEERENEKSQMTIGDQLEIFEEAASRINDFVNSLEFTDYQFT